MMTQIKAWDYFEDHITDYAREIARGWIHCDEIGEIIRDAVQYAESYQGIHVTGVERLISTLARYAPEA